MNEPLDETLDSACITWWWKPEKKKKGKCASGRVNALTHSLTHALNLSLIRCLVSPLLWLTVHSFLICTIDYWLCDLYLALYFNWSSAFSIYIVSFSLIPCLPASGHLHGTLHSHEISFHYFDSLEFITNDFTSVYSIHWRDKCTASNVVKYMWPTRGWIELHIAARYFTWRLTFSSQANELPLHDEQIGVLFRLKEQCKKCIAQENMTKNLLQATHITRVASAAEPIGETACTSLPPMYTVPSGWEWNLSPLSTTNSSGMKYARGKEKKIYEAQRKMRKNTYGQWHVSAANSCFLASVRNEKWIKFLGTQWHRGERRRRKVLHTNVHNSVYISHVNCLCFRCFFLSTLIVPPIVSGLTLNGQFKCDFN